MSCRARRPISILLAVTVLAGFILRVWPVTYGLPFHYRPDEDLLVEPALRALAGDFNPHDFFYPALWFYVLSLWFALSKAVLFLLHQPELFTAAIAGPYLLARMLSAIVGTINIFLTYRLGSKISKPEVGLIAAIVVALQSLAIKEAHFATLDTPLALVTLLFLIECVSPLRQGRKSQYYRVGGLIGIALAIKYSAIIFFPILIAAHFLRLAREPLAELVDEILTKLVPAVACALVVFFICVPYSFLELEGFSQALLALRYYAAHGLGIPPTGVEWLWSLGLPYGLGWPLTLATFFSVLAFSWGKLAQAARIELRLLSIFLVLELVFVCSSKHVFLRYLLPVIPVAAILAASLVQAIIEAVSWRSGKFLAAVILICALCCLSVSRAWALNLLLMKGDTRSLAADWLENKLSSHVQIVTPILQFFEFGKPELPVGNSYLNAEIFREHLPKPKQGKYWILLDRSDLRYFSIPLPPLLQNDLRDNGRLIAHFSPYCDEAKQATATFEQADGFYAPLNNFERFCLTGPQIDVYEIKANRE